MENHDCLLIGWDVGGWNCDRNRLSRDALIILDSELCLIGKPWRGNLRECINQSDTTRSFIQSLLDSCQVEHPMADHVHIVMGIDTPLGFSSELVNLLVNGHAVADVQHSASNPYLFRFTERFLFQNGLVPLSAVKDMIGSQATKGMHVLARFLPQRIQCGVWAHDSLATAVEVYPSSARRSATVNDLRKLCVERSKVATADWHEDEQDALTAALLAWLFKFEPQHLAWPADEVPIQEGWIFVPKDALNGPDKI